MEYYSYITQDITGAQFKLKNCVKNCAKNRSELSFKSSLPQKTIRLDNIKLLLDKTLGEHVEKTVKNIAQKTKNKYFEFGTSNSSFRMHKRGVSDFLWDSLTYPFLRMPLDLLDFASSIVNKTPLIKNTTLSKKFYNSSILKNHRERILISEQVDDIAGLIDEIEKLLPPGKNVNNLTASELKVARKKFNELTQKMFNPNTGHYDSVKERALNRIVSGTIPAFFLANDAYNLSRMIDDDKKEANKEYSTRFNQELTRVGVVAYLQLVLLGGLSQFVNKSKWGSAFIGLGIVLFAETASRLFNGKPVTFISASKAKELAEKEQINDIDTKKSVANITQEKLKAKNTFAEGTTKFPSKKFLSAHTYKNYFAEKSFKKKTEIDKEQSHKKQKNLFTLETLIKIVSAGVVGGLALTYLRHFKGVENCIQKITKPVSNFYNKITKKPAYISEAEFEKIVKKLDELGHGSQADAYREIIKSKTKSKNGMIQLADVDCKYKPLLDFFIAGPLKFAKATITLPHKVVRLFMESTFPETKNLYLQSQKKELPLNNVTDALLVLKEKTTQLSDAELNKYLNDGKLSAFNKVSKSGISNAELGKLVKIITSAATSWFLVADNYNMVMIKSAGKQNEDAKQKAKERVVQRVTALFYQVLLIDLFNSTFKRTYHASLAGMSAVTGSCRICEEMLTRRAIGMPIMAHTKEEILDIENKNLNKKGFAGKYYRFMAQLTGKKTLTQRQKLPTEIEKSK